MTTPSQQQPSEDVMFMNQQQYLNFLRRDQQSSQPIIPKQPPSGPSQPSGPQPGGPPLVLQPGGPPRPPQVPTIPMNTLSEPQMPPDEIDAMENEMFGTPFTGINRFATATRDPVQQEEPFRRITTSQTAQQAVEPIRPNFTRQQPPPQTITIPPRPPDRPQTTADTTWDENIFLETYKDSTGNHHLTQQQ